MRRFHNTLTPLVTAALVILIGFAPPAHAVAPKGAVLSITVTTHSDQGEQTYDSEVDGGLPSGVTVLLSPAAPTLSSQLVSYESSDGTIEIRYSYTITTNANGADDYKLSVEPGASTNMVGEAEGWVSGDPITLSATAALVPHSAGDIGVYVPIPLTTESLPDENQIQVGDTVVIGGAVYKVADHGAVNAADAESFPQLDSWTSHKLIFETPLISDVSVGDLIAEQKTFDMWVWNPKIDDDTLPATVGMIVTATSTSDSAFSVQDETLTSLYPAAGPSIEVFVRNVTVPTTGIDPAYTSISGDDFFNSIPVYVDPSTSPWKVSVSPGDTLQYAIVQKAGNDSAKAPLTNVVLKAGMPPFSTYVPGSTTVNAASLDDVGEPAQSQVFDGVMVQSPGSAAGNIAINAFAEVTFRVIMDVAAEQPAAGGALAEQCTVSDGGINLFEKGFASGYNSYGVWVENNHESCINFVQKNGESVGTGVYEVSCENNILLGTNMDCPSGYHCSDGACVGD